MITNQKITNILYVEGFKSSSAKDKKTISFRIDHIINSNVNVLGERCEISSGKCGSVKKIKKFIERTVSENSNLMVFTSSMGSVKFMDYLEDNGVPEYNKVSWLSVDAHSKSFFRDFFKRIYGKKRPMVNKWKNLKHRFRIWNVFQHNGYPNGADFIDAYKSFDLTGKDEDHYTIKYCCKVLSFALNTCEWIKKN